MSEPFLLVQLSDPHIGADWGGGDSVARFDTVVEAVNVLLPRPRAILLSGDLADHAADSEYGLILERLAPLGVPLYALPGNHDRRDALRRHFELPGGGGAPVQHAADLGPVRLVVVDSTHPGEDWGELDEERLTWLDQELASNPDRPTLIAMHHPPLVTGNPAMDRIALRAEDRDALSRVVERHPQVRRVLAGHAHRAIAGDLAGRPVFVAPSIYLGAKLDFCSGEAELTSEPPGFAVHALVDGKLVSHPMRAA